jgi:glycine cleavage system H lipoate-binding protein
LAHNLLFNFNKRRKKMKPSPKNRKRVLPLDQSNNKEVAMEKSEMKGGKQPVVYSMVNDQCVWSRAGVIKPVKCINAFDCLGCPMDERVLANFEEKRKAAQRGDPRPARMLLLMNQGKCRHMLSGRISFGYCSQGYDCVRCPFDQMLEESGYLPNLKPPVIDRTSGFKVARDHYYHYGHTWARVEYGGRVRIGIDDFALRLFGPQDAIEVPRLGETVGQNRVNLVMKRGGKEAPILSPVDGKVVAVNRTVLQRTAAAHQDPYGEGWLLVVQPASLRNNLKNLFFGQESLAWIDDEYLHLRKLIGEVLGEEQPAYALAATGGEALGDIYGEFPQLGWERLVGTFLHT